MSKILIKNTKAIITVDDKDNIFYDSNILIKDNIIEYIGKDNKNSDTVIDAKGCFVYPGLINTHHHLYQTFTRNLPQVQNMELFDWLTTLYEIWRGLDDDCIYHSSIVGLGELAKYGCTTCMDHHYVFPKHNSSEFIDKQFSAADEIGIRFHATRGSMSRGKSDGGLPPDDLVQSVDYILKDSERLVKKYHDTSKFSMHEVSLAPCSPFSVTTELLKESAFLARNLGVRLHTHLCETIDEQDYCIEKLGMRPLEYMQECGWVGHDVWYAHGIYFNDEELDILSKTKTGIAHCPVSNMKLASGVCRVPDILSRDIPIGLAVDGSASNNCSNLLAEIRASYLVNRLTYKSKSPSGYDILKMATKGSARVLGRDDIGSLEVGKAADLFIIDVDALELCGTHFDAANLLGTVGYAKPCKTVISNGNIIVEDGNLVGIDEEKIRNNANKLIEKLVK